MATPNSLVGAVLAGRYRLTKLIGQGGMGSVYEATDRQMADRIVAVKVLASHLVSDATQVTRFEQEARAANQLRHPNTISVLDFGATEDGQMFMALEYLHGETLTQVLRRGAIEPTQALYMLRQVCKSLAEAHAKGIIHRDLKPDNIFVCEIYGEKDFIKVIDFGIAKLAVGGAELTQVGKMFGTPRYLSPEQAQGLPLAATSDLYSCGVILFEMLTGQAPFNADDSLSIALKHVQEPAPALRDANPGLRLPVEVERLVSKLLAKKPAQRYQSAEEVVATVDACLTALGQPTRASGHFTPAPPAAAARPTTVPPVAKVRVALGATSAGPDDATRTLAATQDATEMLDHLAVASDEATRAIPALDDPDEPLAAAARVSAADPSPAPTNTPAPTIAAADAARGPGQGHTLALEVEATADGVVVGKRPEAGEAPRARAKPATADRRSAPTGRTAARRDGPSAMGLLAVAVVLAAVGAGAAWLWQRDNAEPPPPVPETLPVATAAAPAPAPPPPPPPAPAPPPVVEPPPYSVEIVSDPPGASVTIDGMPAGPTPLPLKLRAGATKIVAVLSSPGYADYHLDIDAQKVREAGMARIPVHLQAQAEPKPVSAKPAGRKAKIQW